MIYPYYKKSQDVKYPLQKHTYKKISNYIILVENISPKKS